MEWSEDLSKGLLQAAPDAVLVLRDGRIAMVNDRAEEFFGRPRSTLEGRPADTLFADDPPTMARRPDGTEFPVEASRVEVDTAQGKVCLTVVRDCEQARQRTEAQVQRNERLESLGQLAGGIAHDFNNMLGVIVNYANFVIEEASGPDPDLKTIISDAQQVIKAGERGTDLTHQLLAFARRDVVRPELLDLNEVVTRAEPALRSAAGPAVTLTVRPGDGLPPVTCDPGQIEQMLLTLVSNARDAMPEGGTLVVDTAHQTIGDGHPELDPGDYVRLRVGDSGAGMDPDVAARAFEPFFTTKASGEGTGLGLATVFGMVSQASGMVSLASEPGVGTTVTVLLPVGEAPAPAPAPAAAARALGHGETLLVVEDEAALREVAGRILSGAGYHVLTADGGRQALELAALHEGEIDLLVSDVVMPGMLGNEVAERLTESRPGTRVLFMSGYAQPVLASQGTLDPGVVLLEKPFTAGDLLTAVRKRLEN